MVPELRKLSYKVRLEALKLPTLVERRGRDYLIIAYKFTNVDSEQFFERCGDRTTRGHNMKLSKKPCEKGCEKYFHSIRVVDEWNRRTVKIVMGDSIHKSKRLYDR